MVEVVYIVVYMNPTGAGPIIKNVYVNKNDAERFIDRQQEPTKYVIETKPVLESEIG